MLIEIRTYSALGRMMPLSFMRHRSKFSLVSGAPPFPSPQLHLRMDDLSSPEKGGES